MTPLTVELRRGRDDWVALEWHRWELVQSRPGVVGWAATGIALVAALYFAAPAVIFCAYLLIDFVQDGAVPLDVEESHVEMFLWWLAAVGVVVLVWPGRRRWSARRRVRQRVTQLIRRGERPDREVVAVTLDADGWAEGDRRRPWSAFFRFDLTATHAFILLDDGDWLVVPAASFPDGRAFHDFTGRARDMAAAARGEAPIRDGTAGIATATPDGFDVRYPLADGDYRALARYVWDANVVSRPGRRWSDRVRFSVESSVLLWAVFVVPLLALAFVFGLLSSGTRVVAAVVGSAAAVAVLRWLSPGWRREHFVGFTAGRLVKAVGDNPPPTLHVAVGPDGIVERTLRDGREPTEARVAWPDVGLVAATDGHLFAQVRGCGWVVVPEAAFAGPAEFAAFVAAVHRLKQAAGAAGGAA
ncbi:MAG: hypothetical protein U0746_17375 [Gemmataceae bacterium]